MNKDKHLFDAYVSHRNTLKINKGLHKFFNDLQREIKLNIAGIPIIVYQ